MEQVEHSDPEADRIQDLNSFAILDSPPEINFDQLAQLASAVCMTPIALISFIDSERQWFKSSVGINLHEIPRHLSACNVTIGMHDMYEIPDLSLEEPGDCINFMKKEGFKFYAGVPITSEAGHNVGTLCVIDHVPRKLNKEQIKYLKIISKQIVDLLELRQLYTKNLLRLRDLSKASYIEDKKILDIAHKSSMRGMAELSAGLSYRIKMQMMIMENVRKRLSSMMSQKTIESDVQLKLLEDSIQYVFSILGNLEKFVVAEQEKWMKPIELCSVVSAVIDQLEHKIRKAQISLHTNLDRDLICIGNITQLAEAIYAVINNAIEAVEGHNVRRIEVQLEKIGHYALIKVRDSGYGVDEKIKPFIFQPFFTTKGPRGLGTGLSLAEAITHKHSGDIALVKDRNPTIFQITLPVP